MSADEQPDRETRKSRYESILRIVDAQTGGPDVQLPFAAPTHTITMLALRKPCFDDADSDTVMSILKRAVTNDDLVAIPCVDRPETYRFIRTTTICLRDALRCETAREHPRKAVVGSINQALDDPDVPQTEVVV